MQQRRFRRSPLALPSTLLLRSLAATVPDLIGHAEEQRCRFVAVAGLTTQSGYLEGAHLA